MRPDLLFDNFNLVTDAPDGIPKMREMILQLAVQGKLVPQDPNDEPASELLKRISAENERLIKEGKIKKQKPLPPIEPNEVPYELPDGWEWVRLGALLSLEYGKGLSKKNRDNGEIPAYGANGVKCFTDKALIEEPSIIIGRKGSAGALNKVYQPCWPLDVTYFVKPSNELFFEYIFQLLASLKLERFAKGIKPGLNRNEALEVIVGIPPYNEQKRITEKADQLIALCDQMEAEKEKTLKHRVTLNTTAIDHLLEAKSSDQFDKHWHLIANNFDLLYDNPENVQKLRQAILQLAVSGKLVSQDPNDEPASELLNRIKAEKDSLIKAGKIKKENPLPPLDKSELPFELPKGWTLTRLGEITQKLGAGSTPLGGKSNYTKQGIKFLRSQNVYNAGLKLENVAKIPLSIHEKMKGTKVQPGDILLNITGASIARSSLVPDDFDEANVSQHVAIIRLIDKSIRDFIHLWIISPHTYSFILDQQVGISREGLSMKSLRSFPIAIPPFKEQMRINKKLNYLLIFFHNLEKQFNKIYHKTSKLSEHFNNIN